MFVVCGVRASPSLLLSSVALVGYNVVSSFLEVFAGVRSFLVRVYLLVAPLGRLCLFHS